MQIIRRLRIIGLLLIFLITIVLASPAKNISATGTPPDEILVIKEQLDTAYRRTYTWTIDKSVTPSVWDLIAGDSGASEYTVSVTRSVTDSDWSVHGVIGIRNQSDHPITITAVEVLIMPANVTANVVCDLALPFVLPAGWVKQCAFSALLPDGSLQTSTATVHSSTGASYSKSMDFDFTNAAVTESGYSTINVEDTQGEAWMTSGSATWHYSRTYTCPAEEEFYQNGLYSFNVPNTATITQTGQSDQANVTVNCYFPKIDIRKQAEGVDSRVYPSGSDISYEIVVTNVGAVALTNVAVTDVEVPGCSRFIGDLAVGETYSYTCTAENVVAGFTNTAVVQGQADGRVVTDEDPSTILIASLDIRKQAEGPDSRSFPAGSDVTFEIVVTNTGDVDLTDVEVSDALAPGCARVIGDLAAGDSYTYTCTVENVLAGFTNVAVATGHYDGIEVEDEDPSTVEIGMYMVYIPSVPVNVGESSKYDIYIGYEDLPNQPGFNDYDYNDFLVSLDTELVGIYINDQTLNLERITFLLTPQARGATLDHEFHMRFPAGTFGSDFVATLTILDENGDPISVESNHFISSTEADILIFDCTCDPLPPSGAIVNTYEGVPYTPAVMTAFLEIDLDNSAPFVFTDYGTHGDGLFFEPYLHIMRYDYDVGVGDTRTIVIPVKSWQWPEERVRLDEAYPLVTFTDGIPDEEWVDQWWEIFTNCVYGDGITCGHPAFLERIKTPGRYTP